MILLIMNGAVIGLLSLFGVINSWRRKGGNTAAEVFESICYLPYDNNYNSLIIFKVLFTLLINSGLL